MLGSSIEGIDIMKPIMMVNNTQTYILLSLASLFLLWWSILDCDRLWLIIYTGSHPSVDSCRPFNSKNQPFTLKRRPYQAELSCNMSLVSMSHVNSLRKLKTCRQKVSWMRKLESFHYRDKINCFLNW